MGILAAGIAAATYAQPALARWCSARVATAGDLEVVVLGLGVHYVRLLTAGGHAIGLERQSALTASPDPPLGRRLAAAGVSRR
jgi:hypothetical protein